MDAGQWIGNEGSEGGLRSKQSQRKPEVWPEGFHLMPRRWESLQFDSRGQLDPFVLEGPLEQLSGR